MSVQFLNYHRTMLTDRVRMSAWEQVIRRHVQPGQVVVDVGSGTGILAFLAGAAGAGRVYAIEKEPIIEVARELVQRTPFADRLVFLADSSLNVSLPEPADVVLGDVFGGGFGLQANLLGAMMDARRRFLKPGGTLLPRGAVLYCMPVELPGFYQEVMEPWTADLNGFDHRPCRTRLANQTHRCVLPPESALAPPFRLGEVRLEEIETASWRGEAEFEMAREGSLHGVGAWCDVRLDQDITASNSPFASRRLAWHHVLFPLETPVEVRAGWRVKACFHLAAEGPWMVWNWRIAVASEHGPAAEFQHSTFRGDLLPPTTFRRSWPASVPVPSDRAEIVRAVLELCDGRRSVAEMRKEIARRFPTAFPNAGQALRLIRSVIDLTCQ